MHEYKTNVNGKYFNIFNKNQRVTLHNSSVRSEVFLEYFGALHRSSHIQLVYVHNIPTVELDCGTTRLA